MYKSKPPTRQRPLPSRPEPAGIRFRQQIVRLSLLVLLAVTSTACVSTKAMRAAGGGAVRENPRVLMMPPDVVVLEITTAGVSIPRADWTDTAENVLTEVAGESVAARRGELVSYRPPADHDDMPVDRRHLPAIRLHQVVLNSILLYNYQGSSGGGSRGPTLVTKDRDALDWTLGPTVTPLRAQYDADYMLFLVYRQASSNAGRAAVTAAAFALFGAISPTSQTIGLASLVDLHTGDIVWTNVLKGAQIEVGEPEGLRKKMREMLQDLPL